MSRKLYKTGNFAFCAAIALFAALPGLADEAALEGPSPGPALEARQKLLDRIQQARSQGMGIGGYMQAFQALEAQVKAGDSEEKVSARVAAIHKAVNEQIERAKILKTQKPIPPQGSQITGSEPIQQGGSKSGPSGGGSGGGDLVSKLKGKFGDKLDALPDSVKDKLMNNPDAQAKIMEKLRE
ncbi:MAG: hypothetical protein K2X27_05545, partial [Candidatus Obscuribacterales bacterium]|nr:hypothetical protein [Candidatus Obscuribacterales bacterium]